MTIQWGDQTQPRKVFGKKRKEKKRKKKKRETKPPETSKGISLFTGTNAEFLLF